MGRIYSVEFGSVAVTNVVDFFEIQPADDKPVKIHSIFIAQSSETGDAGEEMLPIRIIRGHGTSGSGGQVPTARPLNRSDVAFSGVVETVNTTVASAGTPLNMHSDSFNVRTGWFYCPTPETRHQASQADTTIVVRLQFAPADSVTMWGTLYLEEE